MSESKKILFVMTGSIAAYKACFVISRLVQNGHQVQVVATESALKFIGHATLEGLTGKKVASDLFESGRAMEHITLARWADLILVAPATANYINSIANGVAQDLASTLFMAHDFTKPFLLAPAMNTKMYLHPVTQKSLARLKEMGVQVLETASGVLACGEVGWGKLLEPQLIVEEIETALRTGSANSKTASRPESGEKKYQVPFRVLITSGGTEEAIDQVRVITNKSTGATGATVADALTELGAQVTFLHAQSSIQPTLLCEKVSFVSFQDVAQTFEKLLRANEYDLVIHAAALSDYSVVDSAAGKLSSTEEEMTLKLRRNPKLLNSVKTWSKNKNVKLIAFKMTASDNTQDHLSAVQKVLKSSQADLVIHNDLSEMDWKQGKHIYHSYLPDLRATTLQNKNELTGFISRWIFNQGVQL